jgi:TATA-box binding protein (TBP) (component of TFIID and TFIIIB)
MDSSMSVNIRDETFNYTKFEDVPISTQTIISVSNLKFNLNLLYQYLPITEYIIIKKKRGRKKKVEVVNPNLNIAPGSIISIQNKTNIRGSILKESKKENKTYFLNSITIVMVLENGKLINSKISQNGKLQITGCKNMEQCVEMIHYLFKHIKEIEVQIGQPMFSLKYGSKSTNSNPIFIFNVVMKNIDFKVNFNINREKLNIFINDNTNFCSLFESSVNTGVNIKIKSNYSYENNLDSIEIMPNLTVKKNVVPFSAYTSYLDEKEKKKENKKEKYHTFLVFHSGSIIQSGSGPEMNNVYTNFVTTLNKHRKEFEEILNTNNKQDIIKMQNLYNLKPGKKKITRHKNELDLSNVK